ncbi:MAG: ATP-binding cassette domain-containing protein [Candidatus Lokiarchaeota archaeon]|nr:ATP-binding cassette domain-containing protein [Candidatus Lokiarchaeota archaeon]
MEEVLLEMRDLKMEFDDKILFENFSLKLCTNEVIGLTGPSGSGKSTILRIAIDLLTPTNGTVEFLGREVHEWDPRELRSKMVMVPQQAQMFPGTVKDNLCWGLKIHNKSEDEEDLKEILEEVTLPSSMLDKIADNLSGGEKQRVALARSLLLEPKVLLMDEPTSALDEGSTLAVEQTIRDVFTERDLGVIIVTHNRTQAERFTNRIVEINDTEED